MLHKQKRIEEVLIEEVLNTANLFSEKYVAQHNSILEDKTEYNIKLISFFLQVDSLSNEGKYIDVIDQIADSLYNKNLAIPQNMSFINGRAGIAYVFIQVYEITNEKLYLKRAIELIKSADNYFLESDYVGDSLFLGRSGLLLVLLYLYDKTKDYELIEQIDAYTQKIISNVFFYEKGYVWYNPYQLVSNPLCSFGYGASGIGYVFQELGDYFENTTFKEIANKAFIYVNEISKNLDTKLWNDYRKEILDEKDLKEHITHYSNANFSFFETMTLGHSLAHGSSGIIYSQIKGANVLAGIDTIFNSLHAESEETLEIAHLCIILASISNSNYYLEKAHFLFNGYKVQNENDLDYSLLKISILTGESCLYSFPKIHLGKPTKNDLGHAFMTTSNVQDILIKIFFKKTSIYLKQLNQSEKNNEEQPTSLINGKEYINKHIQRIETNQVKLNYIREVFQYEEKLYDSKILKKQSPYYHVKEYLALNKRLKDLNIKDLELISKTLVISDKNQFHKTHTFIKDVSKISKQQKNVEMFWKYDQKEGIKEIPIGLMGFIIYRFNKSKIIEIALIEILLYCNFLSEKKLKPLIDHSNSKNKKDLIKRLPFLFLYQVRLLITDGILEFPSCVKESHSLKNTMLKVLLKLLRISTQKHT